MFFFHFANVLTFEKRQDSMQMLKIPSTFEEKLQQSIIFLLLSQIS